MSNNNLGRVLTLRVVITDPEKAKWIWDNHSGQESHGVDVRAIADGDVFVERDKLKNFEEYFIREEGESLDECISAHMDNSFDSIAQAVKEAPGNTSRGSKWYIIDRRGRIYAHGENV